MTTTAFPAAVSAMFAADERIVEVKHYEAGFVPNSYKWKAPGAFTTYRRDGSTVTGTYDRKRSGGKGAAFVGKSAAGGTLASI